MPRLTQGDSEGNICVSKSEHKGYSWTQAWHGGKQKECKHLQDKCSSVTGTSRSCLSFLSILSLLYLVYFHLWFPALLKPLFLLLLFLKCVFPHSLNTSAPIVVCLCTEKKCCLLPSEPLSWDLSLQSNKVKLMQKLRLPESHCPWLSPLATGHSGGYVCPLPVGKHLDVTHKGTGTEIRQEEPPGSNRTGNRSRACYLPSILWATAAGKRVCNHHLCGAAKKTAWGFQARLTEGPKTFEEDVYGMTSLPTATSHMSRRDTRSGWLQQLQYKANPWNMYSTDAAALAQDFLIYWCAPLVPHFLLMST